MISTEAGILFSDALVSFLEENKVRSDILTKLQNYIKTEEFETDSILMDIDNNIGNIYNEMNDETIIISTKQFIQIHKSMLIHFNITINIIL